MSDQFDYIGALIELAFHEDIADGDHSTLSCIPADKIGKSQLIVKEDGILAGVDIALKVFHRFDPELQVKVFITDGTRVKKGDIAFEVEGKIQSILQTERLVLNLMQRRRAVGAA